MNVSYKNKALSPVTLQAYTEASLSYYIQRRNPLQGLQTYTKLGSHQAKFWQAAGSAEYARICKLLGSFLTGFWDAKYPQLQPRKLFLKLQLLQ